MATFRENVHVDGNFSANTMSVPNASVGDDGIDPGNPLNVDKTLHQYPRLLTQPHGADSVDERRVIHQAYGTGLVAGVQATVVVPATGNSTLTVDVLKNGVSILSGTLTIDNGNDAYEVETIGLSDPNYVGEDVFEVVVTNTYGTGTPPQGLAVLVVFREAHE